MMKKYLSTALLLAFGLTMDVGILSGAEKPNTQDQRRRSLQKVSGLPVATLLNINRMASWYNSSGEQERDPGSLNAGVTYPRGTSQCIYAGGLMWGGNVNDGVSPQLRVNGYSYSTGTTRGAIKGIRTGEYEDAAAPDVRIWRVRRDYATADLRQDAAEYFVKSLGSVTDGDVATVRAQYEKDWVEWPAAKGAPFYDGNGDGKYTPEFKLNDAGVKVPKTFKDDKADEPGIADADQVVWYVAHDLKGPGPWTSPPIGLEVQCAIWGYNRSDALGNVVFKKFRMIYKGTVNTPVNATITDMYLCQWSDPDLGDAGDDYAGCDTSLSVGFVYNSKTLDKSYKEFNIAPPASGYDFLQGPIVPAPGKTAIFDLKYRSGYTNLPMTSFVYFAAGGRYEDPPFNANGIPRWYQMFRGLPPTPQGPPDPPCVVDPTTGQCSIYWLNGDPVAGKGWIDGSLDNPGDRRIVLSSGPFNMAVGDTQELVSALIAGLGSDRLSSISVFKFYDKSVQEAYNNLFDLPKPPPAPKFSAVELDRAIILEWEKDSIAVRATEKTVTKGYKFEGYNVYQLPSATAPITSGKLLATFDLETDPSTITQETFDEASGQILLKPAQLGKNSGLQRYMYIKNDAIRNTPLVNGQRYYFAITAYNYNPDPSLVTKTLESTLNTTQVIPHSPDPGVVLPYGVSDTLKSFASNAVGSDDAAVGVIVFNPVQTGGTYDIWYGGAGTKRDWTVVKSLPGTDYATINVTLNQAQEFPAATNAPGSRGSATLTLNDKKDQIQYTIRYDSLSGPPTGVHIHKGALGAAGGVVKGPFTWLKKKNGLDSNVTTGTWSKTDATQPLTDSLVMSFTSGSLYVNIHTALNPGGEIRGQISDGLLPRAELPLPSATVTPVTSFTENRLPGEGFSLYAGPAPLGFKSASQVSPTRGDVVNVSNPEKTYFLVGPAVSWGAGIRTEDTLHIKFTSGVNYAITFAATPPQAKFIRVPFQVFKDTIRVWPVILNAVATDTVWNVDGNGTNGGHLTFDEITGVVNNVVGTLTGTASDTVRYYAASATFPPTSNAVKGKLINGANWCAQKIVFVNVKDDSVPPASGTSIQIVANRAVQPGDIKTFTLKALKTGDMAAAKAEASKVNVFPNPYYGVNAAETDRNVRFVTFNHLPQNNVTIRIFNLAGILVRTIHKDPKDGQFAYWDLNNETGLPVASGLYIAHIDMKDIGTTAVLKLAIIQEQQFLRNY